MTYRVVVPFTDLAAATEFLTGLRGQGWAAVILGPEGEEYHPRSLFLVADEDEEAFSVRVEGILDP